MVGAGVEAINVSDATVEVTDKEELTVDSVVALLVKILLLRLPLLLMLFFSALSLAIIVQHYSNKGF